MGKQTKEYIIAVRVGKKSEVRYFETFRDREAFIKDIKYFNPKIEYATAETELSFRKVLR